MGIQGLLSLLTSITQRVHVSDLQGLCVGVDTHVWLHRGAYSCSQELCQNVPTRKYLGYGLKMLEMLLHFKLRPILIFDGDQLPSKGPINSKRQTQRMQSRERALEALQEGHTKGAFELFRRAVGINPEMMFEFVKMLQSLGVEYIVAPYEADAQLAYLSKMKIIDAVITEDSDMIPFGCSRILYKMMPTGYCQQILLEDVPKTHQIDLSDFSSEMLRHMCIISGCDYLESMPGVGIRRSHQLISQSRDLDDVFEQLKKYNMPADYPEQFRRANLTFQYQIVYDPIAMRATTLNPLPPDLTMECISFVGTIPDPETATRIARGIINPRTGEPFSGATALINNVHFGRGLGILKYLTRGGGAAVTHDKRVAEKEGRGDNPESTDTFQLTQEQQPAEGPADSNLAVVAGSLTVDACFARMASAGDLKLAKGGGPRAAPRCSAFRPSIRTPKYTASDAPVARRPLWALRSSTRCSPATQSPPAPSLSPPPLKSCPAALPARSPLRETAPRTWEAYRFDHESQMKLVNSIDLGQFVAAPAPASPKRAFGVKPSLSSLGMNFSDFIRRRKVSEISLSSQTVVYNSDDEH